MLPEKGLLARVLLNEDWPTVLDRRITDKLFQDDECKGCFQYIVGFYGKYGHVPSIDLVEEQFPELRLAYAKEPAEYYIDCMIENMIRIRGSQIMMTRADSIVTDPRAGLNMLQLDLSNLVIDAVPSQDDSLADSADVRRQRYEQLKTVGGMDGFATPFPILNEATRGLHAGDFMAIVSRPGVGKTFMLTLFAECAHGDKLKVLFVSCEMSNTSILQRFDAIHFKLPYKELRSGLLPAPMEKRYFDGLEELQKETEFVVTQDVNGLMSISSKIDQYNPDLVLIDGLYLLQDDSSRSSSQWEAVSNISRGLKQMARRKKKPIVATTQFNRATDELQMNKVTLSNLGFSDSLGQDADVVIGLFRNRDMEMNNEMKVRMLKVREGEAQDFKLRWDLHCMRFDVLDSEMMDAEELSDDSNDTGLIDF